MDNNGITRSQYVARNALVSLITQVLKNLLGFISRTVFIWVLGKEYLGINSLFTEILAVLSFAELGIGNAFIFSLYKPLADGDNEHLQSLMRLFSKAYRAVGIAVGILGLAVLPFLRILTADVSIDYRLIYEVYLLYVVNSAVSYFFVYKISLIIADQKNYIVLIVQECFHLIQVIVQIVVLTIFKDYLLYMVTMVCCTIASNAYLANRASKMYPFLAKRESIPLSAEEKKGIVDNIKALVLYKVGERVLGSTDNIFIAAIINVVTVGMYSNYQLLVGIFTSLGGQVVGSVTASVGNANAIVEVKRKEEIFNGLLCSCAWFFGLSASGILLLSNKFIELWVGMDYCLESVCVLVIVITFYVNNMHYPCVTYRYTAGLFVYGKYIPIVSSIINIALDIILGSTIGLPGILLATILARLFTYELVDPMIIYKHVFGKSPSSYYGRYLFYAIAATISCGSCWFILQAIPLSGWGGFAISCLIVLAIYSLVFFTISWKTEGFRILLDFLKKLRSKRT